MPYMPADRDLTAVPNFDKLHPEFHKRWISTKVDKLRQHMQNYGGGAYVPYAKQFGYDTDVAKLKARAVELGLSEIHVDSASCEIKLGDCVLAVIPRAEYERRRGEALQSYRDREEDARSAFLASERRGVRPRIFDSEEEFLDVKEHATRESNNRVGYRGRAAR